jgi:DNA-binding NtrC family response regulator
MSRRVLVVDDDRLVRRLVAESLKREGIEAEQAPGYDEALTALNKPVDAVISDLYFDDSHTGIELMRACPQGVPFILMTGMADPSTSAEAMKLGAAEYLAKPFEIDDMVAAVKKVLGPGSGPNRARCAMRPKAVGELYAMAGRAAVSGAPVLITGEEGAGKEHLAREIHRNGPRAGGPFQVVWCPGLNGADVMTEFARAADGATVLLKHVGELPPAAQASLAAKLAEPGGPRVIATMRGDGADLRPELRYALPMHLHVPPLRERREELGDFADGLAAPGRLTDAAIAFIESFDWRGNLRQLKFAVTSAVARSGSGVADVADLRAALALDSRPADAATLSDVPEDVPAAERAPALPKNRYLLYKRLARTLLSEVWLGWQPSLWRKVIVKLCTGRRPDDVARFNREARILASLKHPGIPAVHEIGEEPHGGRRYFVAEYVDGESLTDHNRRLAADGGEDERIASVVRVVAQAAGVLDYLHARGISHRDVKPANILVTAAERAFVIDYGMARQRNDDLTKADLVQGTIPFMSPEHTSGRGATPAADIWCLGATLYQLLTWAHPFGTGEFKEVALRIRKEDPPAPRLLNAAISEAVERIILRAMAKDPAKRFRTAAEMKRALELAI